MTSLDGLSTPIFLECAKDSTHLGALYPIISTTRGAFARSSRNDCGNSVFHTFLKEGRLRSRVTAAVKGGCLLIMSPLSAGSNKSVIKHLRRRTSPALCV